VKNPETTKAWIAAGKILAIDPDAVIDCPEHHDGTLVVQDIPIANTKKFERIMRCPNCGARNILLMTKKD
jgi:hypothetical protein